LEIAFCKGVILGQGDDMMLRDFGSQISSYENFFQISFSQITWFGHRVAIQVTGMCPHANRSQIHKEFLMTLVANAGQDFDNAGSFDVGVSMVSDGRSSIGGGVEGLDNVS
jgi:hypothetical protein